MDQKLQTLLEDLQNYKDRLSIALKISDICIFEVDLQNQLYTFFENSEGIFGKRGEQILNEVRPFSKLSAEEFQKAVGNYFSHPDDAEMVGMTFSTILAGKSMTYEARMHAGNQEYKWCKVDVAPVFVNGIPVKKVGIVSDITHMKNQIHFLENSLYTDPFTGLYSKKRFAELCESVLADRKDSKCIMMVIDLDHFKQVNDTYGHAVGDEVLLSFSQHLRSVVRKKDIVARFGGDEFVILLLDVTGVHIGEQKAKDILLLHDNNYQVTKSIGISVFPDMGTSYDELFKKADYALYEAKKERNTYCIYEEK